MQKHAVGYVVGVFDYCHIGHVFLLLRCRAQCERFVVAVHTDEFVSQYKTRPHCNETVRMKEIERLGIADDVDIIGSDHSRIYKQYGVTHMYHGNDWDREGYLKQIGKKDVEDHNIQVCFLPYTSGVSSTAIRSISTPVDNGASRLNVLDGIRLVVFDMDGTLYSGTQVFKPSMNVLAYVKQRGIKRCFFSNNTSRTRDQQCEKLNKMGLTDITVDEIVLPTASVIAHLKEKSITKAFVLGTEAVRDEYAQAGIEPRSVKDAQIIVLCYDKELTYEKLQTAAVLINKGVPWIATHRDTTCPTSEGPIPDCGLMREMLEKTTNVPPYHVFGKPDPKDIQTVIKKFGIEYASDVLMVGDRLDTDIEMGKAAGCRTALVLSGEQLLDQHRRIAASGKAMSNPDFILKGVEGLIL